MTFDQAPLAGVRIVDVGQYAAAPFAATLLADFGADVVKVERPGSGDPIRHLGATKRGTSLWWATIARNKRNIALNLRDDNDRELFLRLVEQADVVVENFAAGTLEKLGLGYRELSAANPGVILLRISGFGQTGPNSHRRGFGQIGEAFGGLVYATGEPDRAPLNLTVLPLADSVSGVFGALAIMIALRERDQGSGRGQEIDLALFETIFRLMDRATTEYDQAGVVPQREGSYSPHAFPIGNWQARDGRWVCLSAVDDEMSRRLLTLIGGPELAGDQRFALRADRIANRPVLGELIAGWFGDYDGVDVMTRLTDAGIPCGPVLSFDEIFSDPHYAARGDIACIPDTELGTIRMPGVVPKLSRTPGSIWRAGAGIDGDRAEILRDWLDDVE